jgi:pimeloyl-ACP methyl ester carboxylesterase
MTRPGDRERSRVVGIVASFGLLMLAIAAESRADSVIMKSGIVYRGIGAPDRDNTLVYISDELKRIVIRDSKIQKIEPNNAFRTGERFQLVQPMTVHTGAMPREVISVEEGPWNERGRRSFRYVGSKANKSTSMEQAIIEIGPYSVRIRGVDGFWKGRLATSQVPRSVITALLGRIEQTNFEERERAVRFLMDVGWHAEARTELDRLVRDFPHGDLTERAKTAREFIQQAEAVERRGEVDVARKAQQFGRMAALLKTFSQKGTPVALQVEAREIERRENQQRAADRAMAGDLRALADRLPEAERGFWKDPVIEVLKAIELAPDAVRDRFAAWRKTKPGPGVSSAALFALAMSGYVAGHEQAVPDLKAAQALWQARGKVHEYMTTNEALIRSERTGDFETLEWPKVEGTPDMIHRLELLTRIIQLMPPPRHDDESVSEKTVTHRVLDDDNKQPTEYALRLPPEYHPLRSYPALVVLHSGLGPKTAIEAWAPEAAHRGYIVIAPEYAVPGEAPDYHYTQAEHAAVELALRDARKRYAIDSDRVFVAGQITGGNMAWDCALAHPDLFAGAVVISGLPAKYVPRYLSHHKLLPLFIVLGDLAPAGNEFIYNKFVKPLIQQNLDVTYIEYFARGLEEIPEEIGPAFDWMDRHRREPCPKTFKAVTARRSDDRFYGVVVREFLSGRTTAPEAAEMLGQNLNPARIEMTTSNLSNLVRLTVDGVNRLDVWLSPKIVDFKRRFVLRIQQTDLFKGQIKLEFEPILEDLRIRGDRQQLYWHRISVGGGESRRAAAGP